MTKEEKILFLLEKRGFSSQAEFCRNIDMPKTTFNSILKRGVEKSSINNIIKICKGLNITVDDLVYDEKNKTILSEEGINLIKNYRKLSDRQKIKLEGVIETYLAEKKDKEKREAS